MRLFVSFSRYSELFADFNLPHLHLASPLGVIQWNFALRSLASEN